MRKIEKTIRKVCEFQIACRDGTCDGDIANSSIMADEYQLRNYATPGGVFVDLGAYCGHASVLLASLGMEGMAVEPISENVDMIAENLALNGLSDEVEIVQGCIGTDLIYWDTPSEFGAIHKFVGNGFGSEAGGAKPLKVRNISLEELLENYERVDLLKTDCEGGEWALMKSPREALDKIELIIGEFHPVLGKWHEFLETVDGFTDVSGEMGFPADGGLRLFALRKS